MQVFRSARPRCEQERGFFDSLRVLCGKKLFRRMQLELVSWNQPERGLRTRYFCGAAGGVLLSFAPSAGFPW